MEFKDKVKYVREQLHITQKELAILIGVDYCTVNKWENGVNAPQMKKVKGFYKLCKDYCINFSNLESTAVNGPHVEKVNTELKGENTMAKFLKQFIDCHRVSGASDEWLAGWAAGVSWCKDRIDEFFGGTADC